MNVKNEKRDLETARLSEPELPAFRGAMALPEVHAVALEAQAAVQEVAEVLARLSTALGPSNQLVGAWLQERDILYARQRQLEQQLETNQRRALEDSETLTNKHEQVVQELEGQVQKLRAALEALRGAKDAEQLGVRAKQDGLERQRQELEQQRQELEQQRYQLEQQRQLLLREACCRSRADQLLGKQTQRRPRAAVNHCPFRTAGGGQHARQEAEPGFPSTAFDASLPPSQPHLRVDRVPETCVAQWPDDPFDFELRPAVAPTNCEDCATERPTAGAGAVGDLGERPTVAVRTQSARAVDPNSQQCEAVPYGDVYCDGAVAVGDTRRDGVAALAAGAKEALVAAQAAWASREQELMQEYAAQLHAVWAENRALQADLQSALGCRRTAQQLRASNQALQQQLVELKRELQAAQAASAADPRAPPAAGRPACVSVATSPPHVEPHADGADGSGRGCDRPPKAATATDPSAAVRQQLGLPLAGGASDGTAPAPAQRQSQVYGAGPAAAAEDLAGALRATAVRESLLVSERDKYAAKYRGAKQACREAKQLARHWQSAYWGLVATYEGPEAVQDVRCHDATTRDEAVGSGAPAWDAAGPAGVAGGHAGTAAAAAAAVAAELEGAGAGAFPPDHSGGRGARSGGAAAEAEGAALARGGTDVPGEDGAAPRADGSAYEFAVKRAAMRSPPAVPVKAERPEPVAVVDRPCGPALGGPRPPGDTRPPHRGCNTPTMSAPAPVADGLDAPSRSAGATTRHPCDPAAHQDEVTPGGAGTRTHHNAEEADGACAEPSAAAGNSRWGPAAGFGGPVATVGVREYGEYEGDGSEDEDVDLTQEPTDGDADCRGSGGWRDGNTPAGVGRGADADWQVQEQHQQQQPPWQHQEQRSGQQQLGQQQEWHQAQQQQQPAACYQAGDARCNRKAAWNWPSNSRLATSRWLAEQPGPPSGTAGTALRAAAVGAEAGGGGVGEGGFRRSDSLNPDSNAGALTAPTVDDLTGREDGAAAGRGGSGFGPVADASRRAGRSDQGVAGRGSGGGEWLNKRSRSCEPLDGGDGADDVAADSAAGSGAGGAVNGRDGNAAAAPKPASGGRQPDKQTLPSGRRLVQQQLPFGKRQRPPASGPEQPRRQRQGLSQSWHLGLDPPAGAREPSGAAGDSGRSGIGGAPASWQPAGDDGGGAGHEPNAGGHEPTAGGFAAPPPAKRKALAAAGGNMPGVPGDTCSGPPPAAAPTPAVQVGSAARRLAKAQPSAARQASEAAAAAVAGDCDNSAGVATGSRAAAAAAPSAAAPSVAAAPSAGGPSAAASRDEPGYKYTAVVRGRAEREGLQAVECAGCKAFYDAVATWGDAVATCCNHRRDGAAGLTSGAATARGSAAGAGPAAAAAAAPPLYQRHQPAGQQGPSSLASALRQAGGRHRFKFAPPATPEGFWDIGFGDTQD